MLRDHQAGELPDDTPCVGAPHDHPARRARRGGRPGRVAALGARHVGRLDPPASLDDALGRARTAGHLRARARGARGPGDGLYIRQDQDPRPPWHAALHPDAHVPKPGSDLATIRRRRDAQRRVVSARRRRALPVGGADSSGGEAGALRSHFARFVGVERALRKPAVVGECRREARLAGSVLGRQMAGRPARTLQGIAGPKPTTCAR